MYFPILCERVVCNDLHILFIRVSDIVGES